MSPTISEILPLCSGLLKTVTFCSVWRANVHHCIKIGQKAGFVIQCVWKWRPSAILDLLMNSYLYHPQRVLGGLRILLRKNRNWTKFLPFTSLVPFLSLCPLPISFLPLSSFSPPTFFPLPFPSISPLLLPSTESSHEAWGSAVSSPDKCAVRTAQNRMINASLCRTAH